MGAAPTNQGFWERLKKAEGNRSAETSGKHHWHAPVFGNVPRTATSRGTRDLTGVGCFRAGGSLPVRRWSVQAGRPGFAATDVGKRESGVPSMNEEAFAVHLLMSPFLHPRPSQSSASPECGLERPGATLEVREPVRPRIDVVRRRAVNAAADRVTACAPTVGRDTSARNAPTAIAKRDESRHLGGRRTERRHRCSPRFQPPAVRRRRWRDPFATNRRVRLRSLGQFRHGGLPPSATEPTVPPTRRRHTGGAARRRTQSS